MGGLVYARPLVSRVALVIVWVALCSACTGNPTEAESAGTTTDATTTQATTQATTGATSNTTVSSAESSTGIEPTSTGAVETGSPDTGAETTSASSSGTGVESCHPILIEVLYDVSGNDGGDEWVELFNPCESPIDLEGHSLGWGGETYTYGAVDLEGTIEPGACFVVGGPNSNNGNGEPVYGLTVDLEPDVQNGGTDADGVALFDVPADEIRADTVPIDAVIYGAEEGNGNGLIDATGVAPEPHVDPIGMSGQSIGRDSLGADWSVRGNPTPNECPPF